MVETNEGLAGLFAKIAIISGKIGAVKRDAKHGQNYMYHSADAILGALNGLMSEHGLVVVPTAPNVRIENDAWIISYQFILCDADTGETFVADWASSAPLKMGQNYDDKAMGKAHTYAHKYWLMKLFMISTVDTDDLDMNDSTHASKPAKQAPKQESKPSTNIDDHLPPSPPITPNLKYTNEITLIEVKRKDEKSKPYLVVAGMALFSREPFRQLGYEQLLIDNMAIVNKGAILPKGSGVIIEYLEEKQGGKTVKTPKRMKRIDTEETVEI